MKLLLADSDPARARWIEAELAADAGGGPVRELVRPAPGEALTDAFERLRPDVIVVDMARPDRDALDSVRHVAARLSGPVVMFVDHDDVAFMEEAIAAGVSSYNVVGRALPDVRPIVRAAVALFRRYQALRCQLEKAESGLQRRVVVDQAKAVLMRRRRMSEPDAHRWLQREAMQRARRMAEVAAEVVAEEARRPVPPSGAEG